MKICFFGIYNPDYSRNRVLIRSLKENDVEIVQCCDRASGLRKYLNLVMKYYKLNKDYDILLVAFPVWPVLWLAKILTRKPMVCDAFISLYEAQVEDKRKYHPSSLKARYCWFLDWLSCKLADRVLLDTDRHIDYFVEKFKIERKKCSRILVGADSSVFFPRKSKKNDKKFLVHFHGSFIPLQGIQYIVKAAKILEKYPDIKFWIIGQKDRLYCREVMKVVQDLRPENIDFLGRVAYEELPKYMAKADICLGIFGDVTKTQRVIPNKVYEAIAMKKPVITADTPAARELFTDRENILFCKTADPEDLAKKILELKNNKDLRRKIARNAFKLFDEKLAPKILGKKLKDNLQILMKI